MLRSVYFVKIGTISDGPTRRRSYIGCCPPRVRPPIPRFVVVQRPCKHSFRRLSVMARLARQPGDRAKDESKSTRRTLSIATGRVGLAGSPEGFNLSHRVRLLRAAYVVSGENAAAPQAAEQHVLGGPAPTPRSCSNRSMASLSGTSTSDSKSTCPSRTACAASIIARDF